MARVGLGGITGGGEAFDGGQPVFGARLGDLEQGVLKREGIGLLPLAAMPGEH